ncbi:MAG: TolC family protein [Kiritimatiellia bacterium]
MKHPSSLFLLYALVAAASPAAEGLDWLALAVATAPQLQAARLRVDAARLRVESAGRFPNPEVEGMGSRLEMTDETRRMWEVNFRQPLPKAGERQADRDRARALADMAEADFGMTAGEVAEEAAMALAAAAAAQERAALMSEQLERMKQVMATLEARLAGGNGRLSEILVFQSKIATMRLEIEKEKLMIADAESGLRARLGLAPGDALPGYQAPEPADIAVETSPRRLLASARVREAVSMARMARADRRPMTAVGLRYEVEETLEGNDETVGLAFMTELPWNNRRAARAEERAARTDQAAGESEEKAVAFQVGDALARVRRAENLEEAARDMVRQNLSRLDTELDALVSNAGAADGMAGDSAVLMLMIFDRRIQARMQEIDARMAVRTARAGLWMHVPPETFTKLICNPTTPAVP